ncbi:unnamed protein product [Haemonchus placei]|uniref:Uncharacterized protein n=1 Tax=Haemonchus placei TaxID=6290 RepID=A0A3P7UQ63_HAEPC|nr:unnamed protein product [Haemonchus placei]
MDGNIDEVCSAIDAGYDVNQRDELKRTPLFVAVEANRLDICQMLVERGGAVINANCGSDCNTALHVAVSQENEEIVRYLLSKGASKTIRNLRQETPSQLAQPRSPLRSLVEKYRTHPRQPCQFQWELRAADDLKLNDRRLLPDLVRLGGGEIVVREPQYKSSMLSPFHAPQLSSPIFIVYDIPTKFHRCPKEYNMVSAQWVIESVMEYAIKPVA